MRCEWFLIACDEHTGTDVSGENDRICGFMRGLRTHTLVSMLRTPLIRVLAILLPVSGVVAQNGDRSGEVQRDVPAAWVLPPSPPLTPEEAKQSFRLQPGHRIDLVASEPLIGDPVQIAFDGNGDLWVVEMRGYMPDADGNGEEEPVGRVVKLRDEDGDGVMDEVDVFLDHLVLPRGIAPAFDGLLVIEPPNLVYCRDLDGDGRADDTQILVSGFAGIENPEHAGNGLRYGIDNFYETSQHHQSFRLREGRDGDLEIETRVVPRHGQWGVARDDFGRLFYSPNSDPLIGDAIPKHYASRNPGSSGLPGVPRRVASDRSTWPIRINPGVNRGYQNRTLRNDGTLRTFTAACGPEIFRGTMIDGAYGDAFVCETAGNLVKRYDLTDRKGVPVAAPVHDKQEFLASTDERFRPVNLLTGPDGGLYVVDFARGVVQHRIYMTTWLRKQVEARGLAGPIGMGRIWRVVDEDAPVSLASESLAAMSDLDLVGVLDGDPNGSRRDTAQRLLVERRAIAVAPALREIAADADRPTTTRLHAMWTLDGIESVDSALLGTLAMDGDAVVREHAARVAESLPPPVSIGPLSDLAFDPEPRVRMQAVLSIGELPDEWSIPTFDVVLERHAEDASIRKAVMSGLADREIEMLRGPADPRNGHWLGRPGAAQRQVIRELADSVLAARRPDSTTELVTFASEIRSIAPATSLLLLDRVADRTRPNSKKPKSIMLLGSPVGWDDVLASDPGDCDPRIIEAARAIDSTLRWVGRPGTSESVAVDTSASGILARGRRLYGHCMTCHQANGNGLPPVYPPLADSRFVTGDPERLARILLHGLQGRIRVQGRVYNQAMPAAPFGSDLDLAAVMTYIRQAWDNDADPVTPEFVAKVRADTEGRVQPWTAKELEPFDSTEMISADR